MRDMYSDGYGAKRTGMGGQSPRHDVSCAYGMIGKICMLSLSITIFF